jgi:hypothetical protein
VLYSGAALNLDAFKRHKRTGVNCGLKNMESYFQSFTIRMVRTPQVTIQTSIMLWVAAVKVEDW